MSVLAIDAGTTGVTAVVVTPEGTIAREGLPGVRPALPPAGLGGALAGGDLAGHTGGQPGGGHRVYRVTTSGPSASPTSARRCCCGTARRWARPARAIVWQDRRTARHLHAHAREGHEERISELTGLRLDPYFSGTKLVWLAEEEPNTWALVEDGRYAVGTVDSYLVARMTRGAVARHGRVQRAPHAALRPGEGRLERRALRAVRVPRDALPEVVPSWGEIATTDPQVVPRTRAADRRDRRRPAVRAVRPGLLRRRRRASAPTAPGRSSSPTPGTEVVRSDAGLLSTAAWKSPRGRADLRPRGRHLRDRRGRAVAARRHPDRRLGRGDRGGRVDGRGLRGRGVRACADRPRRAGLGPARPRHDHRHHPGYDARAPRPRHSGGDRVRGARRRRHAARTHRH